MPLSSSLVAYQLPQFGTHHAKMMVLKFPRGVRVVVLTANFVDQDVTGKSQGVWYQEFPLRQSPTCDFEVREFYVIGLRVPFEWRQVVCDSFAIVAG